MPRWVLEGRRNGGGTRRCGERIGIVGVGVGAVEVGVGDVRLRGRLGKGIGRRRRRRRRREFRRLFLVQRKIRKCSFSWNWGG